MFFAYNNGIAATASAAKVNADATGLRLTHVKVDPIVKTIFGFQ